METEERNVIFNTTTIIAVIVGLIVGFFLGSLWAQRSATDDESDDGSTIVIDEEATLPATDEEGNPVTPTTPATGSGSLSAVTTPRPAQPAAVGALALPAGRPTVAGTGSVTVREQAAGTVAKIDSLSIDRSAWVTVREPVAGGFGTILGARRVDAGTQQNFTVNLLTPSRPGRDYIVVFMADDGDGAFESMQDSIVLTGGAPIMGRFHTLAQ